MQDWKERHTLDKTQWGQGPWLSEPDQAHWTDAASGYPCAIVRSPESAALHGHVAVPKKHPVHGRKEDSVPVEKFPHKIKSAQDKPPETEIDVHVDGFWWISFDANQLHDHHPAPPHHASAASAPPYRDIHYLKQQCTELAAESQENRRGRGQVRQ